LPSNFPKSFFGSIPHPDRGKKAREGKPSGEKPRDTGESLGTWKSGHWHTLPEVSGSLVPIGTKDVLTVVITTGFGYGLNRKSR